MTPARPALAAVLRALDGVTDPREAVEVLHARGLWPDPAGPDQPLVITSPRASRHGSLADVASLGVETIATITALVREAIEHARPKPNSVTVVWRVEPFNPLLLAVIEQVVRLAPLVAITRLGVGVSWGHGADGEGVSLSVAVLVPPIDDAENTAREGF